jgi:protein subunit release factor A
MAEAQIELLQLQVEHAADTEWAVAVLAGQGGEDSKAHAAWLLDHIGKYASNKKANEVIKSVQQGGSCGTPPPLPFGAVSR